jgi:uncharacterized protein (TIGR02145 family)
MNKHITATLAITIILTLSCSSLEESCDCRPYDIYGSLAYQGKTYKIVVIGNQTWMAENLNYEVEGGFCFDNDPANCEIYGMLYDWATVMGLDASCNYTNCSGQVNAKHRGICPSGWHISSDEDWDALITAAGDPPTAGKYLKAASGWNRDGNDLDTYGFPPCRVASAIPRAISTV